MPIKPFAKIFIMFLVLAHLLACTKTDDGSPPAVTILSPGNNETFSSADSIHVLATITHKFPVEYVKITLWNSFNIPVLDPLYVYPDAYGYNLNEKYPLSEALESGSYILAVSASDGHRTGSAFITVQVDGIEKAFEKVLAICRSNTLKTLVYGINDSGEFHNLVNLDHGYAGSDISSGRRQLFMLSPAPSWLYAYDLDDLTKDFSIAASPPYPVFNQVAFFDPYVYVGGGNGDIRAFDVEGYPYFISPVNEDTIPVLVSRQYDLVLSFCERRGGPEKFIRQHYEATGVFRASLEVGFRAVAFCGLQQGSILVFGNGEGESSIYLFDAHNNYLADKWDFPPGMIRGVEQIAPATYLISHDAGIYQYVHSTGALSEWLVGADVDAMAFDRVRQLLYYAEDGIVKLRRIGDAALLQETGLPYEVLNLHVQYNK